MLERLRLSCLYTSPAVEIPNWRILIKWLRSLKRTSAVGVPSISTSIAPSGTASCAPLRTPSLLPSGRTVWTVPSGVRHSARSDRVQQGCGEDWQL
jgi:hypothetical protein